MGRCMPIEIGKKFGRLIVLKVAGVKNSKGGSRNYVTCLCECGNIKDMPYGRIKSGRIYSCGCYNKEVVRTMMSTHGLSKTKLYKTWAGMKERCYNPNNKNYSIYGGRGIKICKEWLEDFINFYEWAIKNGYTEKLTIDRIDVNGNYEPSDCRWATQREQCNNWRRNIIIDYKGHHGTIAEVARELNIKYTTLYQRLFRRKSDLKKMQSDPFTNVEPEDPACVEFTED